MTPLENTVLAGHSILARFYPTVAVFHSRSKETEQQSANDMGLLRGPFHKVALAAIRKSSVASIETHTMGSSLFRYLDINVHQDIRERQWSQIVVEAHRNRTPPARVCAIEEKDKPFNWHRPTTTILRRGSRRTGR